MIVVLVLFAFLAGCDARWHIKHDNVPSQSWDQENLKKHDNTCDTIVYYVDPVTKLLEQCP